MLFYEENVNVNQAHSFAFSYQTQQFRWLLHSLPDTGIAGSEISSKQMRKQYNLVFFFDLVKRKCASNNMYIKIKSRDKKSSKFKF